MYLRLARLRRFAGARANECGTVDSLYFDGDDWAVRLVTLRFEHEPGRPRVPLLSPIDIASFDPASERVEFDPAVEPYELAATERFKPLPPESTSEAWDHYDLPPFWTGTQVWGDVASPRAVRSHANARMIGAAADTIGKPRDHGAVGAARAPTLEAFAGVRTAERPGGPGRRRALRAGAAREPAPAEPARSEPPVLYPHTLLMGRGVFAPDGRLGVISDLLLDVTSWRIRYFIVWVQAPGETGEILLSPFWVTGAPDKSRVTVPMTTEAIVSGPTFVPEDLEPLDEQILARYFGFLRD